MSSWTQPVDLRVTDPRSDRTAEMTSAATAAVRSRLGDGAGDVLAMLGLEVAA